MKILNYTKTDINFFQKFIEKKYKNERNSLEGSFNKRLFSALFQIFTH